VVIKILLHLINLKAWCWKDIIASHVPTDPQKLGVGKDIVASQETEQTKLGVGVQSVQEKIPTIQEMFPTQTGINAILKAHEIEG